MARSFLSDCSAPLEIRASHSLLESYRTSPREEHHQAETGFRRGESWRVYDAGNLRRPCAPRNNGWCPCSKRVSSAEPELIRPESFWSLNRGRGYPETPNQARKGWMGFSGGRRDVRWTVTPS